MANHPNRSIPERLHGYTCYFNTQGYQAIGKHPTDSVAALEIAIAVAKDFQNQLSRTITAVTKSENKRK